MNINFKNIFYHPTSLFKENILNSSLLQQNRVLALALFCFSCLATGYLLNSCLKKKKLCHLNNKDQNLSKNQAELPLNNNNQDTTSPVATQEGDKENSQTIAQDQLPNPSQEPKLNIQEKDVSLDIHKKELLSPVKQETSEAQDKINSEKQIQESEVTDLALVLEPGQKLDETTSAKESYSPKGKQKNSPKKDAQHGSEEEVQEGQSNDTTQTLEPGQILEEGLKTPSVDKQPLTLKAEPSSPKVILKEQTPNLYKTPQKDKTPVEKNAQVTEGSVDKQMRLIFNGIIYEGELEKVCLKNGKEIYPDGQIKEGDFKNGKLNGQGKITKVNGDIEKGEFQDDLLHGEGEIRRNKDRVVITGHFVKGELNGKGQYSELISSRQGKTISLRKLVMEGLFQKGKLNGKGTRISIGGTKSEGEFDDNELWGEGVVKTPGGTLIEGVFEEDRLNGNGKITKPDGTILQGAFLENVLHGPGKAINNKVTYEGDFRQGKFHGKGTITYADGTNMEGEFQNNELNGKGKIIDSDGTIYDGVFKNDMLIEGKIIQSDVIYDGQFKSEKLHGQGKKITKDKIWKGEFVEGRFIKGVIFEGPVAKEMLNGQGKKTEFEKIVYEGTFINHLLQGQGKMTLLAHQSFGEKPRIPFSKGVIFEGRFVNDKLEGSVQITYPNKKTKQKALFKNGLLIRMLPQSSK